MLSATGLMSSIKYTGAGPDSEWRTCKHAMLVDSTRRRTASQPVQLAQHTYDVITSSGIGDEFCIH